MTIGKKLPDHTITLASNPARMRAIEPRQQHFYRAFIKLLQNLLTIRKEKRDILSQGYLPIQL
jgi:hypothetical protein